MDNNIMTTEDCLKNFFGISCMSDIPEDLDLAREMFEQIYMAILDESHYELFRNSVKTLGQSSDEFSKLSTCYAHAYQRWREYFIRWFACIGIDLSTGTMRERNCKEWLIKSLVSAREGKSQGSKLTNLRSIQGKILDMYPDIYLYFRGAAYYYGHSHLLVNKDKIKQQKVDLKIRSKRDEIYEVNHNYNDDLAAFFCQKLEGRLAFWAAHPDEDRKPTDEELSNSFSAVAFYRELLDRDNPAINHRFVAGHKEQMLALIAHYMNSRLGLGLDIQKKSLILMADFLTQHSDDQDIDFRGMYVRRDNPEQEAELKNFAIMLKWLNIGHLIEEGLYDSNSDCLCLKYSQELQGYDHKQFIFQHKMSIALDLTISQYEGWSGFIGHGAACYRERI